MLITSNPLKEQYEKAAAAYEELVFSTTPYLWAKALDRISEEERDELYCMLEEIRELEGKQLDLLKKLLPAQREELARLRAVETIPEQLCNDEEDDWLDVQLKIALAEGELREMMNKLAILRRADLVARRECTTW